MEEALATYRALLARYPDDRRLREDYAEVMVDAGLLDQAAPLVDRYLAEDPTSARLRRLRARIDLAAGAPAAAGRRLDALAREQPRTPGSPPISPPRSWRGTLEPRARPLRAAARRGSREPRRLAAYRAILLGHAPRIELTHYSLLQQAATHHVEEAAWRGWLSDRWWLRAGTRYGSYHQERVVGQPSFTEEVWTALATVGFQPTRTVSLWAGSRSRSGARTSSAPPGASARATTTSGPPSPPSRSRSASCSRIRWRRCRGTARPTG